MCVPPTIVLQTDWFPEAEYGVYFSLIGANGKLDAKKGTYSGPLGKTGINLEIRAGGPFIGQQTVQSLMYQDDSIDLGLVHTDDAVRFSKQFPTVSVVAPLEHSPLALVWDPKKHDFKSWQDIGESGAKILVFTKAVNYVPFLIKKGTRPGVVLRRQLRRQLLALRRRHVDPAAGVRHGDALAPEERDQGVRARHRPSCSSAKSGYDPYLSSLSVQEEQARRAAARAWRSSCRSSSRQQIDYLKRPGRHQQGDGRRRDPHEVVLDAVDAGGLADGNKKMLEYEIVSNGTDKTLGNFVPERVQQVIDDFQATFGKDVETADPNVTPDTDRDEQVHRSEHPPVTHRSSAAYEHSEP